MSQGQIKLVTDSIHNCPGRPTAPVTWWILEPAELIRTCTLNADPFRSESLYSTFYSCVQCGLSVYGESYFPSGTCNQVLSGREQRTSPGGCNVSPAPLSDPLRGPPLLPPAYGSRLGFPRFPRRSMSYPRCLPRCTKSLRKFTPGKYCATSSVLRKFASYPAALRLSLTRPNLLYCRFPK